MGKELFSVCQVDTKRLLLILGMMFTAILVFQYFELPYEYVLSSLFSAGKVPLVGESSLQARDGNTSYLDNVNTTVAYDINGMSNSSRISEDEGDNDIVSEINDSSSDYLELDEDNIADKASYFGNLVELTKNSTIENAEYLDNESSLEDGEGHMQSRMENNTLTSEYNRSSVNGPVSAPALPPVDSSSNTSYLRNGNESVKSATFVKKEDDMTSHEKNDNHGISEIGLISTGHNSSVMGVSKEDKVSKVPTLDVYTISDMNNLLLQSRATFRPMVPRWSSAVDQEVEYAKSQIENAPLINNDPYLFADIFRNMSTFKRSYELMEDTLKVYIYKEGEKPILHKPPLQGIYASEGWFMKLLEVNKKFVTKNPRKAHLFYLPFSSRMLEETLYVRDSHSHKNLIEFLKSYLDLIGAKYPFWNRTSGADHFLVACHDWAPTETKKHMAKCIRALCNSDIKEGFVFGKDVSLPETFVRLPRNPTRDVGGKPPSQRPILAFFAGSMHGYLRSVLLQHWENKDPDMKITGPLFIGKGKKNYVSHMKSSKYCICAKGYEVNSPRVVEAIFYECVPVIISDNFVPPFFEVLNWESFAVFVLEKDIPNLKNILLSIPEKRYREMQMRVKKVQQHFLWHGKPVKYDIFHMILHSVWHNRFYQIRPREMKN